METLNAYRIALFHSPGDINERVEWVRFAPSIVAATREAMGAAQREWPGEYIVIAHVAETADPRKTTAQSSATPRPTT